MMIMMALPLTLATVLFIIRAEGSGMGSKWLANVQQKTYNCLPNFS